MTSADRSPARKRATVNTANDYSVENLRLEFFLPSPETLGAENPAQLTATYVLKLGKAKIRGLELDVSSENEQKITALYVNSELLSEGRDYHFEVFESDDSNCRYILFDRPIVDGSEFTFKIELRPDLNSSLEGLYISENRQTGAKVYATQNEQEGFRRITPIPDRPSVPISSIETTILAPIEALPITLSNGDLIETRNSMLDGADYRKTRWLINRPMPGYLYALMAGQLDVNKGLHTNKDGSTVELEAYTDPGNTARSRLALTALDKAMTFDEELYDFVFPFKQMKMAGIASFTYQGMENNTFIIFNIMAIASDPKLSSDEKIRHVIRVTGHEYFHTFTGNEVTIKDFTEPALKEGLTTYREIQFMRDIIGPAEDVTRILILRDGQFLDDRSGLAHAVFPGKGFHSSILYDDTTYRKGAFLYGVLHTLIGDKFYEGMKLYREIFTGKAGNFADFQKVMSDASGMDLSKFFRWFKQAGTPTVTSKWTYNKAEDVWVLTLEQKNPLGSPVLMPLPTHFVNDQGHPLELELIQENGGTSISASSHILSFGSAKQSFKFKGANTSSQPLTAFGTHLLPIIFKPPYNDVEATKLVEASSLAPMLRYEAAQHVLRGLILEAYGEAPLASYTSFDCLIKAYKSALKDSNLDDEMKANLLRLPSIEEMALLIGRDIDYEKLDAARMTVEKRLGSYLEKELFHIFEELKIYEVDAAENMALWTHEAKKRALRMRSLKLLNASNPGSYFGHASQIAQDRKANITERLAALQMMGDTGFSDVSQIIEKIGKEFEAYGYAPLMHEFQSMTVSIKNDAVFESVKASAEKAVRQKNFVANEIYAGLDTFLVYNPVTLHKNAGDIYPWIGEFAIRLAARNKRVTARVLRHFTRDIALLPPSPQGLMRAELLKLQDSDLGPAANQVVERALQLIAPSMPQRRFGKRLTT